MARKAMLALGVLAAAVAGVYGLRALAPSGPVATAVVVPELSGPAAAGQPLFAANCAKCHGPDAGGTDQGPPLIHKIYESGHHSDMAFVLAMRQGSRAHHWRFGDMPPVAGLREGDILAIIAFVRAVQRANGIR